MVPLSDSYTDWIWPDTGASWMLVGLCSSGFVGQALLNRGHQVRMHHRQLPPSHSHQPTRRQLLIYGPRARVPNRHTHARARRFTHVHACAHPYKSTHPPTHLLISIHIPTRPPIRPPAHPPTHLNRGAGLQVAQAAPASMTKYVDVVLALTIQVDKRASERARVSE